MLLQYFVTENKTGACIPVEITPATQSDLLVTKSGWQSDGSVTLSVTPNWKNGSPKRQAVRSLRWGLTGRIKTAFLFLS